MKLMRFAIIIASLLGVLISGGCYKDKGDYTYRSIDTLRIAYDSKGGDFTVLQLDTLRINPLITLTAGSKESDLSFEWSARGTDPSSASQVFPITIMSVKRNLDTLVKLVPGKYVVSYKVTDNTTKISSYLFYNLNVTTSFSEGWLLLGTTSNTGDVAVISPTGKLFDKVYSGANGVSLAADVSRIDIIKEFSPMQVYISSANKGVRVSPTSFGSIGSFKDWFFYPPAIEKPSANVYLTSSGGGNVGILINNGLVHIRRFGGFPPPVLFGAEILLDGKTAYKMSPYIMSGTFQSTLYMAAMYETQSKRFIGLRGNEYGLDGNLVHFPAADATAAFDPDNVGMDALYIGQSRQRYIYNAIMKSGTDGYLLQLNLSVLQAGKLKQKMNAPDIASMTAATSSLQLDYIYYAAGNKIYMYEIGPNVATEIYAFPAGEAVTTLNIDANKSATALLATTWNNTTGKAYEFNIDITGRFTSNTYVSKYEGLSKIVYTKYKPK